MQSLTDAQITALIRESEVVHPHTCPTYDCECRRCSCGAITPECRTEGEVCCLCAQRRREAAERDARASLAPAPVGGYAAILPGVYVPVGRLR